MASELRKTSGQVAVLAEVWKGECIASVLIASALDELPEGVEEVVDLLRSGWGLAFGFDDDAIVRFDRLDVDASISAPHHGHDVTSGFEAVRDGPFDGILGDELRGLSLGRVS